MDAPFLGTHAAPAGSVLFGVKESRAKRDIDFDGSGQMR
jgi:hypothetical protein